jgi:hypothetical protein
MNMDFVDFNLAKRLKDLGFNEPFFFFYREDDEDKCVHIVNISKPIIYCDKIDDEVIIAPTISQVLKWLREDKQIHVGIIFTGKDYTTWIQPLNNIDTQITIHDCDNNNEAAIAGIEYVLNNLI